MDINYARLCARFVAARALITGEVIGDDFTIEARRDPITLELAQRIDIQIDENPDPNALSPIELHIENYDGTRLHSVIDIVYGHPDKPMSREAWLDKFRNNWRRSLAPLSDSACERVIERLDSLPAVTNTADIIDDLVP
jgi:2-methylcitrate dehydratase PrpD